MNAGVPIDGAREHGVSEAVYLRDPDGIGIELTWDRPPEEWPRDENGSLVPLNDPLDIEGLLACGAELTSPEPNS